MSAICRGRLMLVQVPNKSTFFGSMQTDPRNIRERLFEGIDAEYNVTDMGVVVAVIGELENFSMSKEDLESTRLGKHINELRRKAADRALASRAKSLIRKWKNLLPAQQVQVPAPPVAASGPPPGGGGNGTNSLATNGNGGPRLAGGAAVSPRLPRTPLVSPRLAPQLQTAAVSPRLPKTPLVSPRLPKTPLVSPRAAPPVHSTRPPARPAPTSPVLAKSVSREGTGTRASPVLISSSTSSSPSHTNLTSSRPASPVTVELESREASPRAARTRSPSPEIVVVGRKDSPTKRPRPREDSPEIEVIQQPAKRMKMSNGTEARPAAGGRPRPEKARPGRRQAGPGRGTLRTDSAGILNQQMAKALQAGRSKVRTTQELVQNLGIESRAASVSPPIAHLPVTDLVPKESEDQLMNRFFLSQQTEDTGPPSRPSTAASEVTASSEALTSLEPSRGPTPAVLDTVEDVLAMLPPIDSAAVLEQMRREQEEEGEEEEEEVEGLIPVLKPGAELTQQLIEDLNNGQLEHIGGIKDHEGEFREWHEMTSLVSKDGELLHILPYSVID